MSVIRGGEYSFVAEISPELFSYGRELVLVDEPGIQVFDMTTEIGSPLCPAVTTIKTEHQEQQRMI